VILLFARHALTVLALSGLLCGAVCVVLFRRLANLSSLRQTLRRITAHLLEMYIYLDDPVIVFRAQRHLLAANAHLLRAVLLPVLILAPLVFLTTESLAAAYSRAPLSPGQTALLTLAWNGPHGEQRPTLHSPSCLAVETPGVRALRTAEVVWRVRALAPCAANLEFTNANLTTYSPVAVSEGLAPGHLHSGPFARLLDPLHTPIPDPNIASINTTYPLAQIHGLRWFSWFTLFYLLGAALVLVKGRLRQTALVAALLLTVPVRAAAPQTPVILISIDTLRADHLSAYGYTRIHTPSIDSFAGTLFENALCQLPLTLPSHTSLFTSTYPFQNGVEENAVRVPDGLTTLASILHAHGYRTAAFIGSAMLGRQFHLDTGFDLYDSPFEAAAADNPASLRVRRDGALVLRSALQWLNSQNGAPILAFIHLFDLHTPYPSGRMEPETAAYDRQLLYIDHLAGLLRTALSRDGLWRRSIVVLLGDHGEGLGDHGELSHGYFIYRSTVRVPLLIHWPETAPSYPARIAAPVGLIDVAPTLLAALGLPTPKTFQGHDVLSSQTPTPVYTESVYARDQFHWAPLRSLDAGNLHYIEAPKPELYDLTRDPSEIHNLAALRRNDVDRLRAQLTQLLSTARRTSVLAPSSASGNRALLESLGYLSGAGSSARPSNIDPKDRLAEYNLFEQALGQMYSGRLRQAIAGFQAILAKDPANVPALGDLGECYSRAGRPVGAARAWQTALHDDPRYAPAAEALGELYLKEKNYPKARESFEKLAELDGHSYVAEYGLALADLHLGLTAEARTHLANACRLAPAHRAACEAQLRALGAAR
jgi:choline-sulfatase